MFSGTLVLASLLAVNADGPDPSLSYMNTSKFSIPISIQPDKRRDIKEVKLFVSQDEGKNWSQFAGGPPDREGFPYYAPKDGTYWFTVQVVSQQGKLDPVDIYNVAPGQKIIVDQNKPDIKLTAERRGEAIAVHWEIVEVNPNPATFQVDYQTQEMPVDKWYPVPATGGLRGETTFTPPSPAAVRVRMLLKDMAENTGQAEAIVAGSAPPPPPQLTQSIPPGGNTWPPPPGGNTGGIERVTTGGLLSPPQTDLPKLPAVTPPSSGGNVAGSFPPAYSPVDPQPIARGQQTSFAGSPPSPGNGPLPNVLIVRSPQVRLEFEVPHVGTSGLGGVEAYLTTDDGQRWEPAKADLKMDLPAGMGQPGPARGIVMVTLPPREEVVYGVYLVVKNGAGLGKPPPRNGDAPQMRFEVDTHAPEVDLLAPIPDSSREGTLVLYWKVNDRNLESSPITLEWAATKQGPWKVIGTPNLPNAPDPRGTFHPQASAAGAVGSHVWQVPYDVPGRVYLRLTARDMAGNINSAETTQPVVVDTTIPDPVHFRLAGP